MSKILLIGNVIKDVYLALDERTNTFEADADGTPWLDLAFDGRGYKFFRRTSVLGGVELSLEVMQKMGLDAARMTPENTDVEYRYILNRDGDICYLTSDERRPAKWQAPKDAVDWLYIGRSVTVTEDLIAKIKSYKSLSQGTRIAYYVGKNAGELELELAKISNIVFCDAGLKNLETKAIVCEISDGEITMGPLSIEWLADRAGLRTHLSMYSTIAATIFAALLTGKSAREALLLAKLNVENSSLSEVLSAEKLEELAAEVRERELGVARIAESLVAGHKGIFAADESGGSIHKKFESAGIPDDAAHRRDYRNLFFTTRDIEKYVSGAILFDETAHQTADTGETFVEYLTARGIIPGIKVDQGLVKMNDRGETYTAGLDGLLERLQDYYAEGLRFAKWRAAFEIRLGKNGKVITPSKAAIEKNCEILARYAKACQAAGLVPIVEPEVVHAGDYSLETCAEVTGKVLDELFAQLHRFDVNSAGCILKCNMVLAGKDYETPSKPAEVGEATGKVLRERVPADLGGVAFLSGGQTPEQATANLRAVIKTGSFPWKVTFSFARALQDPALEAWKGNNKNTHPAQNAFIDRLSANAKALW